jgi:uncharacterized membrane protein YkoI
LSAGPDGVIQIRPLPASDTALEALVRRLSPAGRTGALVAAALLMAACSGDPDEDRRAPVAVATATTPAPAAGATTPFVPPPAPATAAPVAAIPVEEAITIALDALGGGNVVQTGADDFDVTIQVWEITVMTPDGVRRKVTVDMASGTIVDQEIDD